MPKSEKTRSTIDPREVERKALSEYLHDEQTQVLTALYRPAQRIALKTSSNGNSKRVGMSELEPLVTQLLVTDIWQKHFGFDPSWFTQKIISIVPSFYFFFVYIFEIIDKNGF